MNENKFQYSDQLIARVWKACNFKCNFCNITENERNINYKESVKDIVRNFHYKLKYSNLDSKEIMIVISWWEPSIFQKETIFALKYIKNFFFKKWIDTLFELQTNASNIDLNFAKKLKENWISSALISFYTIDKKIFEKSIWVSFENNFYNIINWILNLHLLWIKININTIISKENFPSFFDTINFLINNFSFINEYNLWIVQPHWEALKNFNIIPKYDDIYLDYNKIIFLLKKHNINVTSHFVWLPACYLYKFKNSLEISNNIFYRKKTNILWLSKNTSLISKINDNNKVHTSECRICLYNNICSWIWKEFFLYQKLKPKKYVVDYNFDFIKNDFAYKLKSINDDLKKIFDSNIRQIIIKSSIWSLNEILNLIRKGRMIWFYKITLLIDSDFILNNRILNAWLSNIQLDLVKINYLFIKKLIIFSKKFSPQFKIDLDLFLLEYNKETLNILIKILKYLSENFINIYYINNKNEYYNKNFVPIIKLFYKYFIKFYK